MKKLTTTLFLAVWLSSCNHYYYVPNVQNVPLFREKNDLRLSGTFGGGDRSNCTEVQAAYSFPQNIGIMANFMSAKGGQVTDSTNWAKGNYFEGAIGYYKPIGKFGVFEMYGGLGGSNQHHQYAVNSMFSQYDHSYSGTSDLSFTKLFVQPAFGMALKGFDFAFSTRISRLSFTEIGNQINRQIDESQFVGLNTIAQKKNYLFLEPAFTIRGGWDYIKMQFQFATASYLFNPDINFETYHISIGLYITIAERFRKDVPKNQ
jgi:hypothetical protein